MKTGLPILLCALTLVACGDDDGPSTGGSGASPPSDGGAGATGGAGGTATTGGTGGTGGAPTTSVGGSGGSGGEGVPCTPLSDVDAVNPTPGSCENNVAVTCGQDGYLVEEPCAADETCLTYDIQEWIILPSTELAEGRLVEWAGCVQTDAPECVMQLVGSHYEPEPGHCDGADKLECFLPPNPGLIGPRVYGTEHGYLLRESCGVDEKCVVSNPLYGTLACIPEDTPPCDGTEPFCDGDTIIRCQGASESDPGYQWPEACNIPGTICYQTGNFVAYCDVPGEVACDDNSFATACEDAATIVYCQAGFTHHTDCSTCIEDGQQVPCRCDTEISSGCSNNSKIVCAPDSEPDCDPQTEADYCAGDVAYRCIGRWEAFDCGTEGLQCDVADGVAGCRAADAPLSSSQSCEGTELVGYCHCTGEMFGFFGPSVPCVPGYEIRFDCASLVPPHSCDDNGFFPQCEL